MKIRVIETECVSDEYCNETCPCKHFEKGNRLFPCKCALFSARLKMDGKNAIKCSDCIKAAAQTVETGCEFCADPGPIKGYAREYVEHDYKATRPPFCPECGRKLSEEGADW